MEVMETKFFKIITNVSLLYPEQWKDYKKTENKFKEVWIFDQ